MLTPRDLKILGELEHEFDGPAHPWRGRLVTAWHAFVLVGALGALVTFAAMTGGGRLSPGVGSLLVALTGVLSGWQLLSHSRRYAFGARLRWQAHGVRARARGGTHHVTKHLHLGLRRWGRTA